MIFLFVHFLLVGVILFSIDWFVFIGLFCKQYFSFVNCMSRLGSDFLNVFIVDSLSKS